MEYSYKFISKSNEHEEQDRFQISNRMVTNEKKTCTWMPVTGHLRDRVPRAAITIENCVKDKMIKRISSD